MSKFSKSIAATATGNMQAIRENKFNYMNSSLEISDDRLYGLGREYRFETRFNKCVFISELEVVKNPEHMSVVKEDIIRAMTEELFGEFRPILAELRIAAYDEDLTRIRNLANELELKMFHEF